MGLMNNLGSLQCSSCHLTLSLPSPDLTPQVKSLFALTHSAEVRSELGHLKTDDYQGQLDAWAGLLEDAAQCKYVELGQKLAQRFD